jgi:hypothetical protein
MIDGTLAYIRLHRIDPMRRVVLALRVREDLLAGCLREGLYPTPIIYSSLPWSREADGTGVAHIG